MILYVDRAKASVRVEGPHGMMTFRFSKFERKTEAFWSISAPPEEWHLGKVDHTLHVHFHKVQPSFVGRINQTIEEKQTIEVKVDEARLVSYLVRGYEYGGPNAEIFMSLCLTPATEVIG